ncbi:MAG: zinc ribbon domain-containing protein [Lachnospiraceae bacterium]|nr:zinc ribbon domain-containing protein [Lachnospiraceae bacterium]
MAGNDRVTRAIDNLIDALNELRDAWNEQQEQFVPQVIISDEPPEGIEQTDVTAQPDEQNTDAPVSGADDVEQKLKEMEESIKAEVAEAAKEAEGADDVQTEPARPQVIISDAAPEEAPLISFAEDIIENDAGAGNENAAAPIVHVSEDGGFHLCAHCGAVLSADSRFCLKCGKPVEDAPPEQPAQQAKSSYCRYCGAQLLPGDRFCMSCGNSV